MRESSLFTPLAVAGAAFWLTGVSIVGYFYAQETMSGRLGLAKENTPSGQRRRLPEAEVHRLATEARQLAQRGLEAEAPAAPAAHAGAEHSMDGGT